MANFIIQADNKQKIEEFMQQFNQKINNNDLVVNPFYGCMNRLKDNYYLLSIDPIYPRAGFNYIAIPLTVVPFLFAQRFTLWMLPGLIIFSINILWSRLFFYIMLKIGLRKFGYTGKCSYVFNTKKLDNAIIQQL